MSVLKPVLEQLTVPGAPFEVVEEEIHGRVMKTYANRFRNLRDLMALGMGHGDKEYLAQGEQRLTFATTFERAQRLARSLHERFGIEPGDRVGIVGANAPDWVVSYWAVVATQGVCVPFNAWWQPAELQFGLEDSDTGFVLCDARRAPVVLAAGFPSERVAVWGEGEVPAGAHHLDDILAAEPAPLDMVPAVDEDETAGLFYTSGTTGKPKGSANTHRNIITNFFNAAVFTTAAALAAGEDPGGGGTQDVNLCVIPLFHATANFTYLVPYVFAGNKLVFMPPGRFDPELAAKIIEQERVTAFGGVPTVVARIIDSGAHRRHDFSSVTLIGYGGAPASPALLERIGEAFPNLRERVANGYGLTETSAISTVNAGPDYLAKPDSVGIPAPVVEVKVVDPDGEALPPGTQGEIWIRGPNVIPGYWNRPEDNARGFTDGFLHTGDVGYLDQEGFLYITDRAKDVIIRGGENVYCVEVEAALEEHPAVREAAVVGVPHHEWGEEVKAIVVAAQELAEGELAEFAAQRLARFKVPTVWELRREPLPRNPSGKVLKSALREGSGALFAVGEESDSAL